MCLQLFSLILKQELDKKYSLSQEVGYSIDVTSSKNFINIEIYGWSEKLTELSNEIF